VTDALKLHQKNQSFLAENVIVCIPRADDYLGTVLNMAPEMYNEDAAYRAKVDVSAFVMNRVEVIVGAPRSSGRAKEPAGPM
jgi:hypothetical protein